jgi:RNA polymerase sigma factor (sigma-70 family)
MPRAAFPTTTWTLVLSAGSNTGSISRQALASLCEKYWYPIYAYTRRRGHPPDEAQDLTQEFFVRLLEKNYIERADRDKGRFRSFLLSSLKFFLSDEFDRRSALKRGGDRMPLPFELRSGEEWYQQEPVDTDTPERIFERRWGLALLERVLARLGEEMAAAGRVTQFGRLKVFLGSGAEPTYAELAPQLDMTESALKVAVHRLRKRYRDLLRAEIAETVVRPEEIDSEIRYLATVLAS